MENDWILTGDIGQFNENGSIQIIDRIINVVKIKEELILTEKLENIYM